MHMPEAGVYYKIYAADPVQEGWCGEYHLALEPSSGYLDHLGEAREQGK